MARGRRQIRKWHARVPPHTPRGGWRIERPANPSPKRRADHLPSRSATRRTLPEGIMWRDEAPTAPPERLGESFAAVVKRPKLAGISFVYRPKAVSERSRRRGAPHEWEGPGDGDPRDLSGPLPMPSRCPVPRRGQSHCGVRAPKGTHGHQNPPHPDHACATDTGTASQLPKVGAAPPSPLSDPKVPRSRWFARRPPEGSHPTWRPTPPGGDAIRPRTECTLRDAPFPNAACSRESPRGFHVVIVASWPRTGRASSSPPAPKSLVRAPSPAFPEKRWLRALLD